MAPARRPGGRGEKREQTAVPAGMRVDEVLPPDMPGVGHLAPPDGLLGSLPAWSLGLEARRSECRTARAAGQRWIRVPGHTRWHADRTPYSPISHQHVRSGNPQE